MDYEKERVEEGLSRLKEWLKKKKHFEARVSDIDLGDGDTTHIDDDHSRIEFRLRVDVGPLIEHFAHRDGLRRGVLHLRPEEVEAGRSPGRGKQPPVHALHPGSLRREDRRVFPAPRLPGRSRDGRPGGDRRRGRAPGKKACLPDGEGTPVQNRRDRLQEQPQFHRQGSGRRT